MSLHLFLSYFISHNYYYYCYFLPILPPHNQFFKSMAGTLASPSTTFLHFAGDTRFSSAGKSGSDTRIALPRRSRCTAALHAVAEPEPSLAEMRRPSSLYDVLGVNKNASPVEIKSAYRSLAKVYHPDSSESSDGGDFIQIHKAYSTLSDPSARALYDLSLRAASARERRPVQYAAAACYEKRYYTSRRWETDQCW